MIRFFHLSDTHLGHDLSNQFLFDFSQDYLCQLFSQVIEKAIEEQVDFILHTGDLFDRSEIPSSLKEFVKAQFRRCQEKGIEVYLLPGNHERKWQDEDLAFFGSVTKLFTRPQVFHYHKGKDSLILAGIPYIHDNPGEQFLRILQELLNSEVDLERTILLHHQIVEGARVGVHNYRFKNGESVVRIRDFPASLLGVFGGHIHKYQTLHHPDNERLPLVYAGSIDRLSFAERKEPKGYLEVIVDGESLNFEFVCLAPSPVLVRKYFLNAGNYRKIFALISRQAACNASNIKRGRIQLDFRGYLPQPLKTLPEFSEMLRELKNCYQEVKVVDKELRVNSEQYLPESFFLRPKFNLKRFAFHRTLTKEQLKELPESPGVYLLQDKRRTVLYIGKSRNMKQRVSSHLYDTARYPWKTEIQRVRYILCGSELEALYLESQLIKRYKPLHNFRLKNYTRYKYLCLGTEGRSREPEIVPEVKQSGWYWGPFSNSAYIRVSMDIFRRQGIITTRGIIGTSLNLFASYEDEIITLSDFLERPEEYVLPVRQRMQKLDLPDLERQRLNAFIEHLLRLKYLSGIKGVIIQKDLSSDNSRKWFVIYQGRLVGVWRVAGEASRVSLYKSRLKRLFKRLGKLKEGARQISCFIPPLYKQELDEVLITYRWLKYREDSGFIDLSEILNLKPKDLLKRFYS